ncbi:hypothetical protein H0H81_005238 [Sphagnurus paluster]|uniref:Lipid droplet-associated perilipin protein n=1 Tax=Sphagnurus paluster TaxID=117069 RepID=A0A9P7KH94_9AGAR|nr:hypothetical protein H0H81_005238 [Sphagnurus paluster]
MSNTETATGASSPAEFTVLTRVASIPMIASSLETIDGALSSNAYTRNTYSTAKGLSNSAYNSASKYAEPLQVRLGPLIVQADGYANKAVDAVEARYPYPFKAKPEEVASLVRESKKSAEDYVANSVNVANKTIDENIKTPAINVAQGIDQRFSPIVDYFEVAVTRLNNSEAGPSTPPDAKYQYQRALALSKTLKDNLYVYSNEQIKQLQAQNVLVYVHVVPIPFTRLISLFRQRATETAQSITNVASSSITSAQTRIHNLSDTMLVELQKLQASTASFSASIQSSVQNSTTQIQNQIPPHIQQTYTELTSNLSAAVTELRTIISTKDIPLQEKVSRVGHEVHDRVSPLLDAVRKGVSELLARGKGESEVPEGEAQTNGAHETNGINGELHHES